MSDILSSYETALQELHSRFTRLELENREFQEQVVAQSSSVMVKEPKVTFPSKFNGDRS